MIELTKRQRCVLDVITNYVNDNGFPPTHLEISLLIGCTSSKAASDHLRAIERKGYIKIHTGIPRGIELLNKELIMMPNSLTAENGAKGLLIGEFSETVIMQCEGCEGEGWIYYEGIGETCECCTGAGDYALKVPIGWGTIKNIYTKCVEHFQNKLDNKNEVI